jgi:hypothetical protein
MPLPTSVRSLGHAAYWYRGRIADDKTLRATHAPWIGLHVHRSTHLTRRGEPRLESERVAGGAEMLEFPKPPCIGYGKAADRDHTS